MPKVLPHWIKIDRDGNITIKGKIVLNSEKEDN